MGLEDKACREGGCGLQSCMQESHSMPTVEYTMLCSLLFVNLTQARISRGKGTSIEEVPPSDWPVGMSMVHLLLMVDVGGPSPLGGVIPRKVLLGPIRKP